MRHVLLGLTLLSATADRASDRDALLAANRSLSASGFARAFTDSAAFLYPGAPLLRGADAIHSFLGNNDSIVQLTWIPAFADVSLDGRLGYTYGWTQSGGMRGKYLACWRKTGGGGGWRISAYAVTKPVPVSDSATPQSRTPELSAQIRGRADPHELMGADSAFAAMSVSAGAKTAFRAFAEEDAVSFGGGAEMSAGREAIAAGFDGLPSGAVLDWWPLGAEIAQSGDLGCTVGEATIASMAHYSKYLTIWKRQPDGSWKFVADGGNSRPAPPASGTPPPED